MSQHKAAMERMLNLVSSSSAPVTPVKEQPSSSSSSSSRLIIDIDDADVALCVEYLHRHSDLILNQIVPLVWTLLLLVVTRGDYSAVLSNLYITFIGVFAAFLANSIPIGGGVVYVPALYLLGIDVRLGAVFSISTMPFGNGVFGFLRWLNKDSSLIIFKSFYYTVIPSSLGSIVAILLLPAVNPKLVKLIFSAICLLLCIFVTLAWYRGGVDRVLVDFEDIGGQVEAPEAGEADTGRHSYKALAAASFLAGLVLVPNIAIGPGMLVFAFLSLSGYRAQAAMVTGIVTGGWVCVVPFLLHVAAGDVPYTLWVMVLPGVFVGSRYAPMVHDALGQNNMLVAFAVFLFVTAALFLFH